MATFRVGQRVRIVVPSGMLGSETNGAETTITGPQAPGPYGNRWRTALTDATAHYSGVLESCLVPLTDPRADEFIARLEKLGREPVGQPMKETVEVRK